MPKISDLPAGDASLVATVPGVQGGVTVQIPVAAGALNGGSVPIPLTIPVISGTPNVGQTVSTSNGTWVPWDGHGALTYAYQWKLDGVDIVGATSSTYEIQMGDVGGNLTSTVTATDANGSTSATSAAVIPTFVTTTLSPVMKAANIVLSNGDLTMNGYYMVKSIVGKSSGLWYYEVTLADVWSAIGIASVGANINQHPGAATDSLGVDNAGGLRIRVGNVQVATGGVAMAAGQVISILLDIDNDTVYVYQNGVLAITYVYNGGLLVTPIHAAVGSDSSTTLTINFGGSAWAYPAIPSGAGAMGWTA